MKNFVNKVVKKQKYKMQVSREFNKSDFKVGQILKTISIEYYPGEFWSKSDVRVKSTNVTIDGEGVLEISEKFKNTTLLIPYDDIREVEFSLQKKNPKSAKKLGKFKMQDNVIVRRVFRDQLGRNFRKTDFRDGEVLKVIDVVGQYPKWGARVKSTRDDALEIHLEGFSTTPLIIPYENIREVQFNPQKKRPKSAMKYKLNNGRGKWQQIVIKALKAKKGASSLPDIKEWITNNYDYNTSHPKNWPKLNKAKRELIKDGTLIKIKGKYRISTKPLKKRPKSATKIPKRRSPSPRRVKAAKKIQEYVRKRKSPKKKAYKFQGDVEWWDNPNIVLPLITSIIAGAWASLVWIENRLEQHALNETKRSRERRKMARKALLKKTTIPEVIIDKITDQYLFSQLDKKYTKSKFKMGDDFVKVTTEELGRNFNKDDFKVEQVVETERNDGWGGMRGPIEYVSDKYGISIRDKYGQLWQTNYQAISAVKYYSQKKKPKSAMKYKMNGGRWTEWKEVIDSEDFWEGQLVRVVPLNGSFGPWGQGRIKKVDKANIQVISSQNKVSVKIPIRDIGLYKYYKPARKKRPKSAMKKSS